MLCDLPVGIRRAVNLHAGEIDHAANLFIRCQAQQILCSCKRGANRLYRGLDKCLTGGLACRVHNIVHRSGNFNRVLHVSEQEGEVKAGLQLLRKQPVRSGQIPDDCHYLDRDLLLFAAICQETDQRTADQAGCTGQK